MPRITVHGVAVVLADGLQRGGLAAARESLHSFWRAVSDAALFSPIQREQAAVEVAEADKDSAPGAESMRHFRHQTGLFKSAYTTTFWNGKLSVCDITRDCPEDG